MIPCEACWQSAIDHAPESVVDLYRQLLEKCEHSERDRHGGWLAETL